MKKYLLYAALLLLALSLCSCTEIGDAVPAPAEPESIPELESIVEPIAEAESESSVETDSQSGLESGRSEPADEVPDSVAEPVESVASDFSAPALAEPKAEVVSEVSESELLEALAPDFRLDVDVIEKELLRLINALRDEKDVSALGIEERMHLAARIRAAEAFESFSHTRPDDTPYTTAFDEAGFPYAGKWHGENLSSLQIPSGSLTEEAIALRMFNGLKSSPGHYRNMTEKNFVQTGIGVAATYTDGMVDVTSAQMFSGL